VCIFNIWQNNEKNETRPILYIITKKMASVQKKKLIGNDGFVELLETFGSDLTVVNAARVSFDKESNEFVAKDAGLINYLAKHEHTSPFFHPQIRFRIRMPIFIAREWFRHTIGFARNEISRRYVDSEPTMWIPDSLRERDANLKQGSKDTPIADNEKMIDIYTASVKTSLSAYNALLAANVAPEIARAVLPQSMYTEFIETGSLAAYARLCRLRTDSHAQKEIQDFANAICEMVLPSFPCSWAAITSNF
jgi:thymidylate synthase (FAD)